MQFWHSFPSQSSMVHGEADAVHILFIVTNSEWQQAVPRMSHVTHTDSRGQQQYVCQHTRIFDCCQWRLNVCHSTYLFSWDCTTDILLRNSKITQPDCFFTPHYEASLYISYIFLLLTFGKLKIAILYLESIFNSNLKHENCRMRTKTYLMLIKTWLKQLIQDF